MFLNSSSKSNYTKNILKTKTAGSAHAVSEICCNMFLVSYAWIYLQYTELFDDPSTFCYFNRGNIILWASGSLSF